MIYFLIPIYNEEENIPKLYEELVNVLPKFPKTYIFVDDCSSDNSELLLKKLFKNETLVYLRNDENQGPGYSFNRGFEYVLKVSENPHEDKLVTLEGDNTSDLSILPLMLDLSNHGFQLVLASVYAQSGGISNSSFFRRLVSFIANNTIRFIFDIKVLTLSSFYRLYNIHLLSKIKSNNINIIVNSGFLSQIEVLLKAIKCNAKIIEVPMLLDGNKRLGKSKMKVFKTTISYIVFFIKYGIFKKY